MSVQSKHTFDIKDSSGVTNYILLIFKTELFHLRCYKLTIDKEAIYSKKELLVLMLMSILPFALKYNSLLCIN